MTAAFPIESLEAKLKSADEYMRNNKPADALLLYSQAWEESDGEDEERKVWILLSISNAAIRSNQVKATKQALDRAFSFVHTGIVVGNPFFHLLVGLTYHLLDENPTAKQENFARAIICGGPSIFNGEAEHHVEHLKKTLEFPTASDTWDTYEGCSLDTLNGATGYLASLIESRIGKPLPYKTVECSDDSDSEEDDDEFSSGDSSEEADDNSDDDRDEEKDKDAAAVSKSSCEPLPKRQRQ